VSICSTFCKNATTDTQNSYTIILIWESIMLI